MKRIIIIICACLLGVGIITGIICGALSCSNDSDEVYVSKMELLEDEYEMGSPIIYRFYSFSDRKFDKLTYSINNGAEKDIVGARVGSADDHSEDDYGFDFYIDSYPQLIDSNTLGPGHYTITFYGYAGPEKIELCEHAHYFKIFMPIVEAE